MYTIAIWAHAALATLALLVGMLVLRNGRLLGLHTASVIGMTAALGTAMVVGGLGRYDDALGLVFAGLAVLALAMTVNATRTWLAERRDRAPSSTPTLRAVDAVGFNVISLVVGAVIIPVLNAGGGTASIIVAVVAALFGSRALVQRRRRQVVRQDGRGPSPGHPLDQGLTAPRRGV